MHNKPVAVCLALVIASTIKKKGDRFKKKMASIYDATQSLFRNRAIYDVLYGIK